MPNVICDESFMSGRPLVSTVLKLKDNLHLSKQRKKEIQIKKMFNNMILMNFIPILLIHLILLPFWLIGNIELTTHITIMEMIIDIIVVPIYLIVVNLRYSLKTEKTLILNNFIFMVIGAFLSCGLHYLNWGVSTNLLLLNPDGETIYFFKLFLVLNLCFLLIGSIIIQILVLIRKNTKKRSSI